MIIYNKPKVKAFFIFFLYSPTLQNILKIFLKSLAQKKGIERNLLIKKFIKNILYSKEQIQINLYYSEYFDALKNSNIPSGVESGGDTKEKRTFVSLSENPQFALLKMVPDIRQISNHTAEIQK